MVCITQKVFHSERILPTSFLVLSSYWISVKEVDRTRGNGFQLKEGRFRWAIRKELFPVRVVRPWLPREAPSQEAFKARLDAPQRNLRQQKVFQDRWLELHQL